MDLDKIELKLALKSDACNLAAGHKNAFQDGILRNLSIDTLCEYVYKPILIDSNFNCIKIIFEGNFAGLIVVKIDWRKQIDFNYFALALPTLKVTLTQPYLIRSIYSMLTRKLFFQPKFSSGRASEIYIFYIAKDFQSKHIGSEALRKYLDESANGSYIVETTSLIALRMYLKLGFKEIRFTPKHFSRNSTILLKTV